MNLTGDPWIPVLDQAGSTREVGLEAAFSESSRLIDLALKPTQRIAVMRLFVAVAYAARGAPKDVEEWERWEEGLAPACVDYLQAHRDAFDLHGPRPFLQVAGLEGKKNAAVDKLDFALSSGNNDTLFDHGGGPEGRLHDSAWFALNLLTYQCFSPGGFIGEGTWGGTAFGRSGESAPAIEGSPLHAIIRGNSLLSTIHLNIVPGDLLPAPLGSPVWASSLDTPEEAAFSQMAESVLGRLVPLSRALNHVPGESLMVACPAVRYPSVAEGGRDLTTTVVVRKSGGTETHGNLRIDLDKHPWRELGSILALNEAERAGPLALQNLHRTERESVVDLWVGGLVANRQKIVDEVEWNFAVPLSLLDEKSLLIYRHGVDLANLGALALRRAVAEYSEAMKADSGYLRGPCLTSYWGQLDLRCDELLDAANNGRRLQDWRQVLLSAMRLAYQEACPRQTPRQLQAYAAGRRRLILPASNEEAVRTKEVNA